MSWMGKSPLHGHDVRPGAAVPAAPATVLRIIPRNARQYRFVTLMNAIIIAIVDVHVSIPSPSSYTQHVTPSKEDMLIPVSAADATSPRSATTPGIRTPNLTSIGMCVCERVQWHTAA